MSEIHGMVWWNELMTRDIPGALDYYEAICGWRIEPMHTPEGAYYLCSQGDKPMAGIMDMSGMSHLDGVPPHWFTYVAVEDLNVALEQTLAYGGVVQRDPWEVPGIGRISIVTDTTGAAVGLIQPTDQQISDQT